MLWLADFKITQLETKGLEPKLEPKLPIWDSKRPFPFGVS